MAKHRTHSLEFKRQVAQEFLAGETLHGLAKRYALSRNLIRIWVQRLRPRERSRSGRLPSLSTAAALTRSAEANGNRRRCGMSFTRVA
jgi:transposase-like protein